MGATRTAYLICCYSLLMSEGFSERRKLAYNLYSAGGKKKVICGLSILDLLNITDLLSLDYFHN